MNILFICNEYPPGKSGGIGSITRNLGRALTDLGHNVFVTGLYMPGYGQQDYEEDRKVKIWRRRFATDNRLLKNDYSLRDAIILKILKNTGLLYFDTYHSVQSLNKFILNLIIDHQIDIVEWPDFNEYFKYLRKPFQWPALPVPLIVKFHGTESYINKQMNEPVDRETYNREKEHIDRADALVSVSKHTADSYTSFYNIDRKITILYNSIDIPEFNSSQQESNNTIVYSGTLTKLKGIHSLLKSWNIVHERHPDAALRIFGKGNREPFQKALNQNAKNSVHFEGFVSRNELDEAMSKAAAAIFPSYTECFAIAPLEAMAVGCPVIYTERASGRELIENGINGLLVNPDDPVQMADKINQMLESKDLQEKFSHKARETLEKKFDIRQSAKDHIAFYHEVKRSYYNPVINNE